MFSNFSGDTADEVWKAAYMKVSNADVVESRNGVTREILHAAISISNPLQKWVTSKVPPISVGFALAELIWILKGSNDAKTINYWNPVLPRYSGEYNEYPGAYGYRIMFEHGINQLELVYQALKHNPDNRQSVILIWNPKLDLPVVNGFPNNKDIPCNICSMIKIRRGKLEWTQIMRSNDLILGLPYNLVQFTSIQEILASWLEIGVGTYNHISDSLHIYDRMQPQAGIAENSQVNVDSLEIKKEDFNDVIGLIYDAMESISHSSVNESELLKIAFQKTGYEAYDNILKIICTYAAYKSHFTLVKDNLLNSCSNAIYKSMWTNWEESKNRR